jgi:hypothetical protein
MGCRLTIELCASGVARPTICANSPRTNILSSAASASRSDTLTFSNPKLRPTPPIAAGRKPRGQGIDICGHGSTSSDQQFYDQKTTGIDGFRQNQVSIFADS